MLKPMVSKLYSRSLWIIVFIIMLPLLILSSLQMIDIQRILANERNEDMRHNIQLVFGVLETLNRDVKTDEQREKAQTEAKRILGNIRFNETGYIWVISVDGRMIRHPFASELEDSSLLELPDISGSRIWVESINTVKNQGEGFITYKWPKPGSSVKVDKTSFIRVFTPWEWIIGTGVYKEDVEIILKKYVKDNLLVGIITLLMSIFVVSNLLIKLEICIIEREKDLEKLKK